MLLKHSENLVFVTCRRLLCITSLEFTRQRKYINRSRKHFSHTWVFTFRCWKFECNLRRLYKIKMEDHYIKIWNEIYVKSENASHTKLYIPTIFHRFSFTLWPNFLLTQFLTNHGSFRSYLYKMNKTTSPYCNCPAKTVQTARHLLPERSLCSKDRPTVLKSLPPPLVLQFHVNTVSITNFLRRIFQVLQEEAQGK